MGLCTLLPACSIFGFQAQPSRDQVVAVGLAPSTAAWVIAEVCRKHLPAADPLTMHAHAPLYRVGPNHFVIHYTAHEGDGFRVIQNGRISGPSGDGSLRGCTFRDSPQASGNSVWASDELWIEVQGTPTGATVVVALDGAPATMGLLDQTIRALRTAESIEAIAALMHNGQLDAAEVHAMDILRRLRLDDPRLRQLTARLHHYRAVIALARGDLIAGHSHLALALLEDPRLSVARRLQARTRNRLADGAGLDATALASGAAEQLARGDLAAAGHWSRHALALSPRTATALHTLAETLRSRGDDWRAYGEELLALERFGFDADLVLGLARRHAECGDRPAGLRLLLRYRKQLERTDHRATIVAMARMSEPMPRRMRARIRQTTGADLTEAVRFEANSAQSQLFRRLAALRRDHDHRDRVVRSVPTRDGYRMAPGVVPALPRR